MNVTQVQLIKWIDELTVDHLYQLEFAVLKYAQAKEIYSEFKTQATLDRLSTAHRLLHKLLSDLMKAR